MASVKVSALSLQQSSVSAPSHSSLSAFVPPPRPRKRLSSENRMTLQGCSQLWRRSFLPSFSSLLFFSIKVRCLDPRRPQSRPLASSLNLGLWTRTDWCQIVVIEPVELCLEVKEWECPWDIAGRAAPFNPATNICRLCLLEKYLIMFRPAGAPLNQNSEFFTTCRHKQSKLVGKVKF